MENGTESRNERIWSFDVGTSSLGYAVRGYYDDPNEFSDVQSLLIPDGFASIKEAAARRRQKRTRESHLAREAWLRKVFNEAGIPILKPRNYRFAEDSKADLEWDAGNPADPRLEREFPSKDEDIAYCGALLRLQLIRGESLADWQVYKAFHSAIQKRGYDEDIPWKNTATVNNDEDGMTGERMTAMEEVIESLPEGCQFPCFWESSQMGLWDEREPGMTRLRIDHNARSAKRDDSLADPAGEKGALVSLPAIYPRRLVEREIRAMFAEAEKQYPKLRGKVDELLYGPTGIAYASYHANHKSNSPKLFEKVRAKSSTPLVQGKGTDWQGVLSQKIPTFDNRGPEPCRIFPKLRVAKAMPRIREGKIAPDSVLPAQVTFLKKLKDFRYMKGIRKLGFTATQIGEVFDSCSAEADQLLAKSLAKDPEDIVTAIDEYLSGLRLTKTKIAKTLESMMGDGFIVLAEHSVIESPKASGRSRFSRPAFRVIKELILSGKSPEEFREELINGSEYEDLRNELHLGGDKPYHLQPNDLSFLNKEQMGETWEGIYLPNETLAHLEHVAASDDKGQRQLAIRELISGQLDPIVRHRLTFFHHKIVELEEEHGAPDRVVLEFVREDFMGPKAKKKLLAFQKKRRLQRAEARAEAGADNKDALKMQLIKEQGSKCLYTGEPLAYTDIADYDVDHIVPRSMGGPDAYYNFVVTKRETNHSEKKEQAPWEWLSKKEGWDAYVERVNNAIGPAGITQKKARLLISEDAPEMVSRYQTLAETAWIAKLAQTVTCLHFGWPLNFKGINRRIVTLPGGLTNKTARRYKLYSLLGDSDKHQEYVDLIKNADSGSVAAKAEFDLDKKNRADKRHHALDAMILSFLPQWTADPGKRIRHKLPAAILNQGPVKFFGRFLDDVIAHQVAFTRPELEQSIYGKFETEKEPLSTITRSIKDIAYTGINPAYIFKTLKGNLPSILSEQLRQELERFVSRKPEPSEDEWLKFLDVLELPNGTRPKRVKMTESGLGEYANLSKDGTGAWRKGNKHHGYFVCFKGDSKIFVRPVYAYESREKVRRELMAEADIEVIDFFFSQCLVRTSEEATGGKTVIPAGLYRLATVRSDAYAVLISSEGMQHKPIALKHLIKAGLERVS